MKTCLRCGAQNVEPLGSCSQCRAPLVNAVSKGTTRRARSQDPPGATGLMLEPWLWQPSSIGRHQPKATARAETHLLVPPFGEALRLEPSSGRKVVLGRGEECDVRIGSPTVSRRHAEIVFRGQPARAFVRDLGTKNGTRLNGALVVGERTLEDRDVLRVGDVTAVYRVHGGSPGASPADPSSRLERLNATLPLEPEAAPKGLAGEIELVPIDDLLGRLTILRSSGHFSIEVDGLVGRIEFESGRVVLASFGDRTGDAALRTIGALTRGRFRFEPASEVETP
ncbi:FHA domain-containing protein [bacterium]|nr:FHA domain-containing protein [bacterium]